MEKRRFSLGLIVLAGIVLAACTPTAPMAGLATDISTDTATAFPAEISTQATGGNTIPEENLKNGTYYIDGQSITLVNGIAEIEMAPGSASKQVTRFFGNEVEIDLNADGLMDSAFLLQQENGGSGTFYYVAAALKTKNGYLGTNAIFIGDRIAPQSVNIDPGNPSRFIVNFADRNDKEPISSPPTMNVSKTFKLENGSLIEVALPLPPSLPETSATGETCKKIALVISTAEASSIYTVCPDGSGLARLTGYSADLFPAWSPDGGWLAFSSTRAGGSQIFVMKADGSNLVQLTSEGQNDFPIWLPDGRQIAFRASDGKGLWWWRVVDLESRQISQLTEPSFDFFYQTPAWSPDGRRIAYMSLEEQKARNDGSSQIHVKNLDGSGDVALTHDTWANIRPLWSPDGKSIAFLSERDGVYNSYALYVMAHNGQDAKKLSDPVFSETSAFAWSPDGTQIAIDNERSSGKIFLIDLGSSRQSELAIPVEGHAFFPSWQP